MADQPLPHMMPQGLPAAGQAAALAHGNAPGIQPLPCGEVAIAPQVMPLAGKPRTFLELYQDGQRDPCQGRYAQIMARFNPEVQEPVAANTLWDQALGTPPHIPQAYFCCGLSRRGIRIHCLHMPSRFVGALDGRVTPWDGTAFAFLGDVICGLATTVIFPPNAFQVTGNVRVLSQEGIIEGYQHDQGRQEPLPPVEVAAPEGQLTYTRMLMYLPPRYVPYFLDAGGYTVRQVWETLIPLLQANDDLVNCRPLIDWLRVTSHYTPPLNGQQNLGPPATAMNLITPLADAVLLEHRAIALSAALPGKGQMGATMETALLSLAQSVVAQTNDARLAREANAAAQEQPALPSTKYKNTIGILLEYLQVQDEMNLPQLWHQWANSDKKQEHTVLKELLDACARLPTTFSTMTPVITPKLLQDLRSFTFFADTQDDLKTGLQPFIIADGSEEHRRANLELARQYGLLQESYTGITLSDLQALEAKEVKSIPTTYFDLEKTLGMFGNLLQVVLGVTHPLTASYRLFWDQLTKSMRNDLQVVIDTTGRIKPAHILRSTQLLCHRWFAHKRARIQPKDPDFVDILDQIYLQSYLLPHLPSSLYRLAYPIPTTTRSSAASSVLSHNLLTTVTPSSIASGSTDQSMVSALTTGTRQTTPTLGTGASGRGAYQANLTPDATLIQLVPGNVRLRDLMTNATAPQTDDGTPICLSYHLRSGCWSNCTRRASHKILSAPEKQRLAEFSLAQLPKVHPAGAAHPAP
jgi:hypothetical protein